MIARLLLIAVAIALISGVIVHHFRNSRYTGEPVVTTVEQLERRGAAGPEFVRLRDIRRALYMDYVICFYERNREDEESKGPTVALGLYVPILDAAQIRDLNRGKQASVSFFFKSGECDPKKSSYDAEPILADAQGPLYRAGELDRDVWQKFAESKILTPVARTVVYEKYTPQTAGNAAIILGFSALFIIVAILPFLKRDRWPTESELEKKDMDGQVSAVYPLLSIYDSRAAALIDAIQNGSNPVAPEMVLLRINCEERSGRPALAVVTNKRYLLYRTDRQWLIRTMKLLKRLLDAALDKVPFGGLLGVLLDPFGDAYEVLTRTKHSRYYETMGYEDAALIGGTVLWHKCCDLPWRELRKQTKGITVKRHSWSEGVSLDFVAMKLFAKRPPGFIVTQKIAYPVVTHLLEASAAWLAARGWTTKKDGTKKVELTWATTSPTERESPKDAGAGPVGAASPGD